MIDVTSWSEGLRKMKVNIIVRRWNFWKLLEDRVKAWRKLTPGVETIATFFPLNSLWVVVLVGVPQAEPSANSGVYGTYMIGVSGIESPTERDYDHMKEEMADGRYGKWSYN